MSRDRLLNPLLLSTPPEATVTVNTNGRRRIEAGLPWIYAQDVLAAPDTDVRCGGPAFVRVLDERGRVLGLSTFARGAPIALRLLSVGGETPAPAPLLRTRIAAALALRATLALDRTALRLIHGEGDGLPGLFVDRYHDTLVVQTTTCAMDAVLPGLVVALCEQTGLRRVLERNDGSMRDFEGLPRRAGWLVPAEDRAGASLRRAPADATVYYRLGAITLGADLLRDGKTGGFLDQADNHAFVARLCRQGTRFLDAFAFHGGFGLAAAKAGAEVLALECDARAVERMRANVKRNGLTRFEIRPGDAFPALASLEGEGRTFDIVVLDPPALAKRAGGRRKPPSWGPDRAAAVRAARRGYGELLLRGMRLVTSGGILVACSCSGQVDRALWDTLVAEAASRAGRTVQVLARLGASADHPERLGLPETGYLKCWVLRIS